MRPGTFLQAYVLLVVLCSAGCRDEFEKMQKASEQDLQALTGRFRALVDEAKKLKAEDALLLLHHFGSDGLSGVKVDEFKTRAAAFVTAAAAGKYDKVEIRGARAPGRLRLLLLTVDGSKWNIPFVKSAAGWKFDDVEVTFGSHEKAFSIRGAASVTPPSLLVALAALQEPEASTKEKVQAAVRVAEEKNKDVADRLAASESNAWAKTALLYASWKSGGTCEPFAQAFPAEKEALTEMYNADSANFGTLVAGISECVGQSKNPALVVKVYQACSLADPEPRSVLVEPFVALANAKPAEIVKAALQLKIPFDEDVAANIVVGALHGEDKSPMVQYLKATAGKKKKKKSKEGKLATAWLQKMAELDEKEPPGGAEGQPAADQ